jgi:eukaryotic-like serine/threonine-protein kinase
MLWGGSYQVALEIAEDGIACPRGLEPEDPEMLALRYRRASAARFLGRTADAEAEFRQVLDARQRILGPEHPDTLNTADNLRHVCGYD